MELTPQGVLIHRECVQGKNCTSLTAQAVRDDRIVSGFNGMPEGVAV